MFNKELHCLLPLPVYEHWPQKPNENLPLSTDLIPSYSSYIIPSVVFLSRSEFMYMVGWYNTYHGIANVIWDYNSFDNNLRKGHVLMKYLKMSCSFDSDLNSISNVMRKSLWLEGHHQDSQT